MIYILLTHPLLDFVKVYGHWTQGKGTGGLGVGVDVDVILHKDRLNKKCVLKLFWYVFFHPMKYPKVPIWLGTEGYCHCC